MIRNVECLRTRTNPYRPRRSPPTHPSVEYPSPSRTPRVDVPPQTSADLSPEVRLEPREPGGKGYWRKCRRVDYYFTRKVGCRGPRPGPPRRTGPGRRSTTGVRVFLKWRGEAGPHRTPYFEVLRWIPNPGVRVFGPDPAWRDQKSFSPDLTLTPAGHPVELARPDYPGARPLPGPGPLLGLRRTGVTH